MELSKKMAHSGGLALLSDDELSKAVADVVATDWSETILKIAEIKLDSAKQLVIQVEQRCLSSSNEEYLMMLNGLLTSLMK